MAQSRIRTTLRSRDLLSMLSPRIAWRLTRGMARAPFNPSYAGAPLAVCWFTNFSCNAACHFCCKAAEIRSGIDRFPPLNAAQAQRLLIGIRRSVDMLYLSGGEPTIHPLIGTILTEAKALNFTTIGMSTNLLNLHHHRDLLDHLDVISCSIHGPDPGIHARNLGVSLEAAEQAFANLDLLAHQARQRPLKVVVNCVINAENINHVLDMVPFTAQRGFLLEIVPANERNQPPRDLVGNPRYTTLIDTLLRLRRAGKAPHLAGSTHYYRQIRDFIPFRCFPYGVPNIMPDGRLCSPCDIAGNYAVNVLDYPDLKQAIAASLPHLGAYPCKQGHCFKAGIIERSRLFGLLSGAHTSHAH